MASTLYSAHSDRLGRQVTVTVYPAPADEATRQRFDQAAATAQRLATHPSVLAVHDWGRGPDGRPWVVTDPQPAETVDTVLKTRGPLPAERALQIGVLVAGALETAHRAGIVHGDLSPARLVFGSEREPLVADIGLAEFSNFLGFGAMHNPIRYFAPPEVLERTGVTPASDVYSLATTIYALLAGRAPHEKPPDITDSNASLLLRILQIEVPPIARPDVPPGIEAALHAALAHAPEKRPLRALDLAWSLQDVQRNAGLAVTEPIVLDLAPPAPTPAAEADPAQPPAPQGEPPEPQPTTPAALAGPVPPRLGTLPAWYTDPLPSASSSREADLVHLFSETPPDLTNRSFGAVPGHWANGLDHLAGSATPGNGERPDRNQPGPRPTGLNGTGRNGHRPAARSAPAQDVHAHRREGPATPPTRLAPRHEVEPPARGHAPEQVPVERRPLTASGPGGHGASFGTVPIRPGSALDRARRARGLDRSSLGPGSPNASSDRRALASTSTTARAAAPAREAPSAGPPALPVIVLIVVVILLTLGVAYMVITGDGGTDPVTEQPGAHATLDESLDQA